MRADGAVLAGTLPRRAASAPPAARPARIARMLALGICIRNAVEAGQVASYADVAKQLGVSRQRISTLVRLTFVAPDLQEQILSLTTRDAAPTEREVFEQVSRHVAWADQRAAWRRLVEIAGRSWT